MANVRLKGLNRTAKRLSDGTTAVYWYAWKGGPRLPGNPGSPEFIAAFNKAVADRKAPKHENLAALVTRYKASPEFNRNAESTKAEWRRWLDKIGATGGKADIGDLPFKALEDRRVRAELLAWRDQWADRPRSADYAIQVLSRVLSWGVDRGLLAINITAGIAQLYESNRADQVWTDAEIARYRAAAPSPEVSVIVPLACLTGMRREDLTKLSWSHVGDVAIVMATGKSRGRKTQTIPLTPESRALLADIKAQQDRRYIELCERAAKTKKPAPPKALTVLSTARKGRPWTPDGLEGMVIKSKAKAGVDKHLHDAKGTFGTRLRKAGLSASEIADVLGWEEDRVQRLLATYVDRDSIVRDIAERIAKNESSAKSPN